MFFSGKSELQAWKERWVNSALHWGQSQYRHYLSGALSQQILLCHNRSFAGAKDSQYKHALMSKRKEGRSKSNASFLHLLQRQRRVPFLNYLWCYLGSIYRLWSGSLLEVHSPDCINLAALSVSHTSFPLSQPEMHSIPCCSRCDLSALFLNCWSQKSPCVWPLAGLDSPLFLGLYMLFLICISERCIGIIIYLYCQSSANV